MKNFDRLSGYDCFEMANLAVAQILDIPNYEYVYCATPTFKLPDTINFSTMFYKDLPFPRDNYIIAKNLRRFFGYEVVKIKRSILDKKMENGELYLMNIDVYYATWITRHYHRTHKYHLVLLRQTKNNSYLITDPVFNATELEVDKYYCDKYLFKTGLVIHKCKNVSFDLSVIWRKTIHHFKSNDYIDSLNVYYDYTKKFMDEKFLHYDEDPLSVPVISSLYPICAGWEGFCKYLNRIKKNLNYSYTQFDYCIELATQIFSKWKYIRDKYIKCFYSERGFRDKNKKEILSALNSLIYYEKEIRDVIFSIVL